MSPLFDNYLAWKKKLVALSRDMKEMIPSDMNPVFMRPIYLENLFTVAQSVWYAFKGQDGRRLVSTASPLKYFKKIRALKAKM